MPNSIEYTGSDKWKQKATELLNQTGTANVDDVKVIDDAHPQGASVVTNKVAEIDLTPYAKKTGIDTLTPTFTEAGTRANIQSGETVSTLFGKIKKFFSDLKAVAFSGSYNDLSDQPTIPAAQVNSDWNATSGKAQILNKPTNATQSADGFMSSGDKTKLDGVATGAEVNQNAFSKVKVGSSTIQADSKTDTIEIVAGDNVTLTPDTTNDKVTIDAENTKNTAGATNTSSKIFLIGATGQNANPQTYSHDTAYVGTDGCLYSGGAKVLTSHQDISGKMDKSNPTAEANFNRDIASVTIDSTASNHVESDTSPGFVIRDSADYYFARMDGLAQTNGYIAARLIARNKDASGTVKTNTFRVGMKKDGTADYYVTDKEAFRTAIGLGSMATQDTGSWQPKLTEQWLDLKSDASISSGTTAKNCGQFTIEKGTWLIMITVRFSPNATGFRGFSVNTGSATGSSIGMMFTDIKDAANGQYTYCRSFGLHAVSASTTLYIGGWQNSGSTLTYSTRVHLVKLH